MALHIELNFTLTEAVSLFREAGLTVEIRDREYHFRTYHNASESEILPTWIVVNPHTGEEELLKEYFIKYMEKRKNDLFLKAEKLDIYTLFPREKQ